MVLSFGRIDFKTQNVCRQTKITKCTTAEFELRIFPNGGKGVSMFGENVRGEKGVGHTFYPCNRWVTIGHLSVFFPFFF